MFDNPAASVFVLWKKDGRGGDFVVE